MNHPTIPEALKVITDAMNEDKEEGSYYFSWQANIAMAFYDEYIKEFGYSPKMSVIIHEIANNAAKRFLENLCTPPENKNYEIDDPSGTTPSSSTFSVQNTE